MAAAVTNSRVPEKVTEDVLDDDGHVEFSRKSSNVAMEGYDQIVLEIAEQVRLMTLEEGIFTQLQCNGEAAKSDRLDPDIALLRQVEKTAADTHDLIVRVNVAISACKFKSHHDAKKLQEKMDALQNGEKGFQKHTKIYTDFSNALANTCYNYLSQRNQTYKMQYLFWKVTPSSVIFQQYSSYRNVERITQVAVLEPECGGDGPSGPDTAAATTATKDSKQSEPNSPTSPTSSPTSTVELANNAAVPISPESNASAKADGTTNAKQPEATSPAASARATDVAIAITSSVSSAAANMIPAATPQASSSAANTVVAETTHAETSGSQLAAGIPTS